MRSGIPRPPERALKKLCSKCSSQVSTIRTADVCLISDTNGQMVQCAEYFEQLFIVEHPSKQLRITGLQTLDADLPIDEIAPSIDDVKEAVSKLRVERHLTSVTSVWTCSKLGVKPRSAGCLLS